jgi:hypothetical protein
MSDNITTAITNATEEFLKSQIKTKEFRIEQLEEAHSRVVQRSTQTEIDLTKTQNALRDWTREQLKDENITEQQALELAHIGDFRLSQCYDVTMTVEHTFTIEVEAGEDIDDVLSSVDFNVDSYSAELMNSDYNCVETNYEECD